jgi:hypothetical protein
LKACNQGLHCALARIKISSKIATGLTRLNELYVKSQC